MRGERWSSLEREQPGVGVYLLACVVYIHHSNPPFLVSSSDDAISLLSSLRSTSHATTSSSKGTWNEDDFT